MSAGSPKSAASDTQDSWSKLESHHQHLSSLCLGKHRDRNLWVVIHFLQWKERDWPLALPPNIQQRKKKVVLSNPDLSLNCFRMAKVGERNRDPQVTVLHKGTEVTHTLAPTQAVLVLPCRPHCSPWPWITLSNWPQLSHNSSPARYPYLYLQGCVWRFPEDWKSYRSSLNLRGQAKQTGREQNSSGCLTRTGFEIMYRLHIFS